MSVNFFVSLFIMCPAYLIVGAFVSMRSGLIEAITYRFDNGKEIQPVLFLMIVGLVVLFPLQLVYIVVAKVFSMISKKE